MARIRSVHPGLFTDEAFMALSDAAQVLFIGLWTEADDQGVFEWKPVTLRARLRPAKDGSIEPMLSELEAANCILRYEISGRKLGAIRNFCRYQRPKKPNSVFPTTPEIRTYTGLSGASSELDEDEAASVPKKEEPTPLQTPPVPPKSEKSPQMEDGGGRREDGKKAAVPVAPREAPADPPQAAAKPDARIEIGERVLAAAGIDPNGWMEGFGHVSAWLAAGYDLERDVLPTVAAVASRAAYKPPKTLKYFAEAIAEAWQRRQLEIPAEMQRQPAKTAYEIALDRYIANGRQGPRPKPEDYPAEGRAA